MLVRFLVVEECSINIWDYCAPSIIRIFISIQLRLRLRKLVTIKKVSLYDHTYWIIVHLCLFACGRAVISRLVDMVLIGMALFT